MAYQFAGFFIATQMPKPESFPQTATWREITSPFRGVGVRLPHLIGKVVQSDQVQSLAQEIGIREGTIDNIPIVIGRPEIKNVDTVTLYLNASRQKEYYDYIFKLRPKRIIFNPGAENPELEVQARAKGVKPLNACTLVLLRTGQF